MSLLDDLISKQSAENKVVVKTNAPSFPILGLLGVIFVTLKLTGTGAVAGWSWWWVTAPFWGPMALLIGAILLVSIIYGVVVGIGSILERM